MPRDRRPDSTLALLRDPYRYVGKECRQHGTDLFEARILLRSTICMRGPEAAELFYDEDRFVRHGAAPVRLQKSLFGVGGVQGLDDEDHRRRKAMFMAIMQPGAIDELARGVGEAFAAAARSWAETDEVVLYDALHEPLMRAVCAWAGVPLTNEEAAERTRDVVALFDAAGNIGPRHWGARLGRRRSESWIADVVRRIRDGRLDPPDESAACLVALHRDRDEHLLDERIAAVELLSVLRPTVAISVFIVHAAHALHVHRGALEAGTTDDFVHEVRRYYPFFPAVMARVRRAFRWRDYNFPVGRRVLLDLYGTNHDERTWQSPEKFRPERFRRWDGGACNYVPQGGGDFLTGHRCAGEHVTLAVMRTAVDFLAREIVYEVPEQDLRIDYSRLPALPRSRFRIRNVRPAGGRGAA